MAKRKIQIIPPDGGYVDVLHPETSADQVQLADVGGKFTATNVEGALSELFQNVSDGKQLVASAITGIGQSASGSDTFVTLANKINAVPKKTAATYTPSATAQTISAGQYLSGTQTITGDADLVTGNIKSGANIFGVAGKASVVDTADASMPNSGYLYPGVTAYVNGAKITGTMPNRGSTSIALTTQGAAHTIAYGYHDGGTVTASFANLVAENIKSGVNVGGVVGTVKTLPNNFIDEMIFPTRTSISGKTSLNNSEYPLNTTAFLFMISRSSSSEESIIFSSDKDFTYVDSVLNSITPTIGTTTNITLSSSNKRATLIFNPSKSNIAVTGGLKQYTILIN